MIPPKEPSEQKFFATIRTPEWEQKDPEGRINAILSSLQTPHDVRFFDQFLKRDVKLHSFTKTSPKSASAVFRFKVDRFYCNPSGNLHGGAQSLFFDILTSLAIQGIGTPDFWMNAGVSRNLDCTYLRPAPEGTILLCEVEVVSAGKNLALLRGVLKREDNGAIISTCSHDKAAVKNKPGFDVPKL